MPGHITLEGVRQEFWVRPDSRTTSDRRLHRFIALDDLSLEVNDGELMTIVGPSGCGKSTILDLVAGLASPATGSVKLDGKEITGPGLDRRCCRGAPPRGTVQGALRPGARLRDDRSHFERARRLEHRHDRIPGRSAELRS
jgi:ABC-type oligopeptide transport system ATPase subunit